MVEEAGGLWLGGGEAKVGSKQGVETEGTEDVKDGQTEAAEDSAREGEPRSPAEAEGEEEGTQDDGSVELKKAEENGVGEVVNEGRSEEALRSGGKPPDVGEFAEKGTAGEEGTSSDEGEDVTEVTGEKVVELRGLRATLPRENLGGVSTQTSEDEKA